MGFTLCPCRRLAGSLGPGATWVHEQVGEEQCAAAHTHEEGRGRLACPHAPCARQHDLLRPLLLLHAAAA